MAGVITCPLDVVKTRIQTQHNPSTSSTIAPAPTGASVTLSPSSSTAAQTTSASASAATTLKHTSSLATKPGKPPPPSARPISTSSPSTALRNHGAAMLDTSSVLTGLRIIYRTEGIAGWFRGVGPRFVWTSVQSGTMLVLYQTLLRWFDEHPLVKVEE